MKIRRLLRAIRFQRSIFAAALAACVAASAWAQTDFAPEQRDLPPVAAPTDKVSVSPIPVVRSESEVADDFAAGLFDGLIASGKVREAIFVAVKDDHVVAAKRFGAASAPDRPFDAGVLAPVLTVIAMEQLLKEGKLAHNDPGVVKTVSEETPDLNLLRRSIEKAAGTAFADYARNHILVPLGASGSSFGGVKFQTTLSDASQLLLALSNDGSVGNDRVFGLEAIGAAAYERPNLAGMPYEFWQLGRNGWSTLERDLDEEGHQSRIVIVPDAKLAYFIAFGGKVSTEIWRASDDLLFNQLLPPRETSEQTSDAVPGPSRPDAQRVSGVYEPMPSELSFLKKAGERLRVEARSDGALLLSGSENAVLEPHAGGYWAARNGNLDALPRDGVLMLSTGWYRLVPLWKRPSLYALLALFAVFATSGANFHAGRTRKKSQVPSDIVLGGGSAAALLLLVAALVWFLSPAL